MLLIVAAPQLSGCGSSAPVVPSRVVVATPHWKDEKVFFLGRIPYLNPTEVVASHKHFLTCLAKELKVDRVSMVMAANYEGVIDLLENGRVDAAWIGTMAYVDARSKGRKIIPVACPIRWGRKDYEGCIIARKGVVKSVADLSGKTFAFVDPRSASGYLLPRALLEKVGVRVPEDLVTKVTGTPDFLGKHDNVVMAIYLRRFAAGAVYKGAVERVFASSPEKASELTVLACTGKVPNEPVVVSSKADAATVARLKAALLALHFNKEQEKILDGVSGFYDVKHSDYSSVMRPKK